MEASTPATEGIIAARLLAGNWNLGCGRKAARGMAKRRGKAAIEDRQGAPRETHRTPRAVDAREAAEILGNADLMRRLARGSQAAQARKGRFVD